VSWRLQYYRESVAHREALDSSFQALRGLRGGKIQLAIGEGFVSALSSLLQKFVTKNAGVLLSVSTDSTLDVIRHVVDDEAHIGLVFHAPADPRLSVRCSIPQTHQAHRASREPAGKGLLGHTETAVGSAFVHAGVRLSHSPHRQYGRESGTRVVKSAHIDQFSAPAAGDGEIG